MTLRLKIFLLGLTAIVGMAFALWRQYDYHAAEFDSVETMVRNIETVSSLSSVAHELQRERGLATFALAGATPGTTLAEEIARTDAALARLAGAGWMPPDFLALLARVRSEVFTGGMAPLAARDDFSVLLRTLIDEMARLAREPALARSSGDVVAHVHLVAMKEYLGQMRATLVYWLADPRNAAPARESLTRIKALFDEEWRTFELAAAPALRAEFRERFAGVHVEATQETLLTALATGSLPAGLDARGWLEMATVAIDRLFDLENRSLELIEQKAASRRAELRAELTLGTAAALATALFVLALAVSASLGLLRALRRTLAGMERIAATQDFRSRIPVESSDEIGRIARSFNALLEIAERLLHEKEFLAATDPLTGIANRLRFAQAVEEEAQRKRRNGTPMALVVFDIDRFKQVNDRFGHNTGDAVLKRLVDVVRAEVRATDFFARWGGEEFILLLRDDNCDAAYATAEKLRKLIAATEFPGVGKVTCSFGVTAWEEDDTAESLVSRADKALYASKHHGRDLVSCGYSIGKGCRGLAACP